MRSVLHQSRESWEKLQSHWDSLLATSASDTIFLTWEWMSSWWNAYAAGRPLFVISVWDSNSLVGIAPFYVDREVRMGIRWKVLKFIGDGSHDSDYLDFIARAGQENQVITAVFKLLEENRRAWDWVRLEGPADGSPCASAVLTAAKAADWKWHNEPVSCATLVLPQTWDGYLKMLKPRFRTKARSSLRLFEEQVGGSFSECNESGQLEQWLPLLYGLHTKRWQRDGMPGVFRSEDKQRFYAEMSRSMLSKGWLAFHRLDWCERILALQFGFRYGNRFYLLQEGYDPAFDKLRPGVALRARLMRHWIKQGLSEYDFLAGASAYKMEWGAQQKLSMNLVLAPQATAWIALDLPALRTEVRKRIGAALPESVLVAKRALRAWRASRRLPAVNEASNSSRWLRSAARLYGSTPVGDCARHFVDNFAFDRNTRAWFPLQRRSEQPLQIFIYHRVNDDGDPYLPSLPVSVFRAQMEHLAKTFRMVSLDDVSRGTLSQRGDKSLAAITFDDGYRDNLSQALPILRELGISATIFLATGFIESGEIPWYDRVCLAFKLSTQKRISVADLGGPEGSLENEPLRLQLLWRTVKWLRGLEDSRRVRAVADLFRVLRVPADLNLPNTMLTWEEVRQMSKDKKITVGAHTISHPVLSRVSGGRLREEIAGSKQVIENELQQPVRHFAYPFGQPFEVSEAAKQAVREAGFETAVTTVQGLNYAEDDRFELRRLQPWETDPALFALRLDWYRLFSKRNRNVERRSPAVGSTIAAEIEHEVFVHQGTE